MLAVWARDHEPGWSSMSKSEKWVTRCEPTAPVTLFAKGCIKHRLKSVRRFAALAAKDADENMEHVHQLRVCVRRANAAIKLFSPLLAHKKARKTKKLLRALRQAAGPARELDVLAERLAKVDAGFFTGNIADLRRLIAARRADAQRPIKRIHKKSQHNGFARVAKKLVKGVKWRGADGEPDFRSFARTTFEPIMHRFFAAGQANLHDIDALHRLRIEGKTVRYAMELLSPALDESFCKELRSVFAQTQDRLGAINDHASAIRFYRSFRKEDDARECTTVIKQMIDLETTELESSRLAFLDWWSSERISDLHRLFNESWLPARDRNSDSSENVGDSPSEDTSHWSVG